MEAVQIPAIKFEDRCASFRVPCTPCVFVDASVAYTRTRGARPPVYVVRVQYVRIEGVFDITNGVGSQYAEFAAPARFNAKQFTRDAAGILGSSAVLALVDSLKESLKA